MLKGQLALEADGVVAAFIGMVGIEGQLNLTKLPELDPASPLAALARPWLSGTVNVNDTVIDGRMLRWSSGYVAPDGTFYGLSIPGGTEPVQATMVAGTPATAESPQRAIGGLRPCAAPLSAWTVGSAEAMTLAMANTTFSQAITAAPGQTMLSVLWMGPQTFAGCGAPGNPFWWLAYGDLQAAFEGPTPMMVAVVGAGDGDVAVATEWLRLRPAHDVRLFDEAVPLTATGTTIVELGDVAQAAKSITLQLTSATVLGGQYAIKLVGPDAAYDVDAASGATGGTTTFTPALPSAGSWSLEITPAQPAAVPSSLDVTFVARQ